MGAGQEPHWQLEDTSGERTMLASWTRPATCEPSSARDPMAAEAGPTVPSAKQTPSHFSRLIVWFSEVMCTSVWQEVECSTEPLLLAHSFIYSFIYKG